MSLVNWVSSLFKTSSVQQTDSLFGVHLIAGFNLVLEMVQVIYLIEMSKVLSSWLTVSHLILW